MGGKSLGDVPERYEEAVSEASHTIQAISGMPTSAGHHMSSQLVKRPGEAHRVEELLRRQLANHARDSATHLVPASITVEWTCRVNGVSSPTRSCTAPTRSPSSSSAGSSRRAPTAPTWTPGAPTASYSGRSRSRASRTVPLAQWREQPPPKRKAPGSSPGRDAQTNPSTEGQQMRFAVRLGLAVVTDVLWLGAYGASRLNERLAK